MRVEQSGRFDTFRSPDDPVNALPSRGPSHIFGERVAHSFSIGYPSESEEGTSVNVLESEFREIVLGRDRSEVGLVQHELENAEDAITKVLDRLARKGCSCLVVGPPGGATTASVVAVVLEEDGSDEDERDAAQLRCQETIAAAIRAVKP